MNLHPSRAISSRRIKTQETDSVKRRSSRLSAYIVTGALLAAVAATPTLGSAAGLANTPFYLKATNSETPTTYAIKPLIKQGGSSAPGSGTTPDPTGTATPTTAPTSSPTPSYPTPTRPTYFNWSVAPDGGANLSSVSTSATEKDIVIPQRVTVSGVDRPVTSISTSGLRNQGLTSIVIPDTVSSIGAFAFDGNKLTSIAFPKSLTTIAANTFSNNLLTSVVLPDSIKSVGTSAFEYNKLTSITFSKSMTSTGSFAFGHNSLTSLEIPDTISVVDSYSFYYNNLTSVKIPGTVSTIGDNAFRYNSITSLSLSTGLKTIGDNAFLVNANIANITIPSTVTSIGVSAFLVPDLKAIYMEGNAPTTITDASQSKASFGTGKTIYYKSGATGYTNPWKGYPTAIY